MRLLLLLGFGGCASFENINADGAPESSGAADTATATAPTDTTENNDTTDTDRDPEPAWFALRAVVSVLGGVPVATPAEAELTVVDADLETVICTVPLDVGGLVGGPASVTEGVHLWWTLPVTPKDTGCAPLPATVRVGVGELVPDLRAQLGAVGLDDASAALYGAFAEVDAGGVSAFGVAGTAGGFDGEGAATVPVPDGAYTVQPLFLLPLP